MKPKWEIVPVFQWDTHCTLEVLILMIGNTGKKRMNIIRMKDMQLLSQQGYQQEPKY